MIESSRTASQLISKKSFGQVALLILAQFTDGNLKPNSTTRLKALVYLVVFTKVDADSDYAVDFLRPENHRIAQKKENGV